MSKKIYFWKIKDKGNPRPTYASISLHKQLGFQKPMKNKFSALKTKIWNESHIV